MSQSQSKKVKSAKIPVLTDASNYNKWKKQVETQLFRYKLRVDLETMSRAKTLDRKFFKIKFKKDYIEASVDEYDDEQDPFDDADFVQQCFDYAMDHDDGFHAWLFDFYADVLESLSPEIQEKVGGEKLGDLVGLVGRIKLAIKHFEVYDPTDLEILFVSMTMEKQGKNDVMTFLAQMKSAMERLKVAASPVSDAKAMRVLVRGLHQEIFSELITRHDVRPFTTFRAMEQAVLKAAGREKIMEKLAGLVPGQMQSTLTTFDETPRRRTRSQTKSPTTERLDNIETVLTNISDAVMKKSDGHFGEQHKKPPRDCFYFANGNCRKGALCSFSHGRQSSKRTAGAKHDEGPPRKRRNMEQHNNKYCTRHGDCDHTTKECRVLNNPNIPTAKKAYQEFHSRNTDAVNALFNEREEEDVMCTQHVLTLPTDEHNIDKWCCDGASTTNASFDRQRCFNIEPCRVTISGPNAKDKSFVCLEKGHTNINVINKTTGETRILTLKDVLISKNFPFHIYSEINAYNDGATATKRKGHWQFFDKSGAQLFSASQPFNTSKRKLALYFIDEAPSKSAKRVKFASSGATVAATTDTAELELSQNRTSGKEPKINTRKNNALLFDLHIALDHRNFRDIAEQFNLSLPDPLPLCWACLMAKPKSITVDKVSGRITTRPYEGMTADAKGPMNTQTPEGYLFFFVLKCLYSSVHWVILTKSQAAWAQSWPNFVKRAEASTGLQRCVSYIITDGHKVHTQPSIAEFNADRGVQTVTSAPYSQWQDPAESSIKIISQAARAAMIHGGAYAWMWGWACLHAQDSINILQPPNPVAGHEGKSRHQILWPAVTKEKLIRRLKPFLCLAMKTTPKKLRRSNFEPRAEPCVNLHYDSSKKAWALLTLPNFTLTYSVDVRHITSVFPLRITNQLGAQLYKFLAPADGDDDYARLSGPGNLVRRQQAPDTTDDFIVPTPAEVQRPNRQGATTRSTSSQANVQVTKTNTFNALEDQLFTADDLAKRTPRGTMQALQGPDRDYWLRGVLKDFRMLRDKHCFKNITQVKPIGPSPPPTEQRFKIKYREQQPVKLSQLADKAWKVRTIARGDRFKHGIHFDDTAAPVAITPALKMMLAWGVALGLHPFQFDESDAFYGNDVDIQGIIVKLPLGYDPFVDRLRPLDAPPLYAELVKSVPGMPQGSLVHYEGMVPDLAKLGFVPTDVDPCLFIHHTEQMAIAIHVDDGVLMCPSRAHAETVLGAAGLGEGRKLTWEPLYNTLGVNFTVKYTPSRRTIFMHQRDYAVTVLRRAQMFDANSVLTPAVPGRKYTKNSAPKNFAERKALDDSGYTKKWYHMIVASLNFLTMITRDDMRFIQGKNAKYCANPGMDNFNALKHQLRFLKGTVGYGIEFAWNASDPEPVDGPLEIQAYSDSSFADDVDTGRTTLGTLVQTNGATTSSSSKLSYRVDSCVNHSELHAFDAATVGHKPNDTLTDGASVALLRTSREVTWARGVKAALEKRSVATMPPTPIFVDNSGVLSMLQDRTMKAANKHIYRTLAENRERVHLDKSVVPVKIHTKKNLANALTKQEPGLHESAKQLRLITGPQSANGRAQA